MRMAGFSVNDRQVNFEREVSFNGRTLNPRPGVSFSARQPSFIRDRSVDCFDSALQIFKSIAHFGVASLVGLGQSPGDIATRLHMVLSRFDQFLNVRIFFGHLPSPDIAPSGQHVTGLLWAGSNLEKACSLFHNLTRSARDSLELLARFRLSAGFRLNIGTLSLRSPFVSFAPWRPSDEDSCVALHWLRHGVVGDIVRLSDGE
jgi:hypothetical protein